MSLKYILLDAMGIQPYIFRTNTLKIILGSSLALARWQEDCRNICVRSSGDLITSAGGNVLARFDDPDSSTQAISFKDACLQNAPPGMEIAWAIVDGNGKKDSSIWSDLQREIARYKSGDRIEEKDVYPSLPLINPLPGCKHCGIKPNDGAKKVDEKPICADCYELHDLSRDLSSPTNETSIEIISQIPSETNSNFPTDLPALVTNEKGEQELLAIVVLDLNDMGVKVKGVVRSNGFEGLHNFSSKLEKDFRETFEKTIREITFDAKVGNIIRLRPLMVAGDDAVFAMPVSLWISFVQKALCKLKEREISACAGVAVAKHTYPINRLAQMAEHLVTNAKNRYRWENKISDALIDWYLHQETSFTSPVEIRKRNYLIEIQENAQYEVSTQRPYTLEELNELIAKAEKLKRYKNGKSFSNRKLFSLYRALRSGTTATRNTLVYTFLRNEQDSLERYKPLWGWVKDIPGDEPLWEKTTFERDSYTPELYDTKIADVIELGWFLKS